MVVGHADTDVIAIHEDHVHMTKLDPLDPDKADDYRSVKRHLQRMVERAPAEIESRCDENRSCQGTQDV